MKFFLKCKETTEICDKTQYNEASRMDQFKMKLHLFICGYCRSYSTKNKKLTDSIKSANIQNLPAQKKHLLKDEINREIRN